MNRENLRREKKDCQNSPFLIYHLSIQFLPFYSYTIMETLILSRKLTGSFRVRI